MNKWELICNTVFHSIMLLVMTIASIDFTVSHNTVSAGFGIFSCLCFVVLIIFFDIPDIKNYCSQKTKQQRTIENEPRI